MPLWTDLEEQQEKNKSMILLFVCSGNTCRSPMAEYLCRALLKEYKISNVEVYSAGIFATPGMMPPHYAQRVMEDIGIDISTHLSRELDRELLDSASFIFVMTTEHEKLLKSLYPEFSNKIFLLGEEDIPDPYGENIEKYKQVCDKIEKEIKKFIEKFLLRGTHENCNRC